MTPRTLLPIVTLLLLAPVTTQAASPAQRCAATKQKAAGKKAAGKLKCWMRAVKRGESINMDCIFKAELKFSRSYDKAESRGGCVTTNDKGMIETKVDGFVDDVVSDLTGSPAGALLTTQPARDCAARKLKATGRKASSKLKCWAKGTLKGTPADSGCLARAEGRYSKAWDKAELKGGCATSNDKTTIEGKVDVFVGGVVAMLPSTPTTTTTPTTSTTTTTLNPLCGNAMLDPGEECDGSNLGGAACGGSAGGAFPDCTPGCTLDCSPCPGGVCQAACADIVPGQPIANTYKVVGVAGPKICITSAAANALQPCNTDADCGGTSGGCLQTPWVTADGFAFQFPMGIQTVFTVAAADPAPTCSHTACIQCGNPNAACTGIPGCGTAPDPPSGGCSKNTCCDTPGFTIPTFNVPILGGLCGRVDQVQCGTGVVNTSRPQTGDNEVIKTGDTSDPGADCTYGTGDDCSAPLCSPCTVTGQGADTKGKVVRSVGNGSPDVSGVHFRISTPELATVWQDSQNPCPDGSTYDVGEGLISQLVLNAEPSSAGATGSFGDLNGDGCSRAGFGFKTGGDPNTNGPITVGTAVARPQSYDGAVGSIQVAAGPIFSGSPPLNDVGFVAITPNDPAQVAPAETCTCVPVPGCPE